MRKVLLSILLVCIMSPVSLAFSFNGSGYRFAGQARYYPQNNFYANRLRQQRKNYIYSPQQARYYGYRVPQQPMGGYYNPYGAYNPYRR